MTGSQAWESLRSRIAALERRGDRAGARQAFARYLETGGSIPQTTRLRDGTIGYYVRVPREDDCWAAAVATCLQIPIALVPDAQLDRRVGAGESPDVINLAFWQEWYEWLRRRGLQMVHHSVPAPESRWIGIILKPGLFNSHCLILNRDEVLFDPGEVLPREGATRDRGPWNLFDVSDVDAGVSFVCANSQ